jgi:hypothetical protein
VVFPRRPEENNHLSERRDADQSPWTSCAVPSSQTQVCSPFLNFGTDFSPSPVLTSNISPIFGLSDSYLMFVTARKAEPIFTILLATTTPQLAPSRSPLVALLGPAAHLLDTAGPGVARPTDPRTDLCLGKGPTTPYVFFRFLQRFS